MTVYYGPSDGKNLNRPSERDVIVDKGRSKLAV